MSMASELTFDPFGPAGGSPPRSQKQGKKSWDELRQAVRETRKLVSALASRVPTGFKFRTVQTENGPVTRLYFLGIPPKQRENTLLYVNVPSTAMNITPALTWCPLLDSFQSSLPSSQMSREEQLLRERKRLGIFGITSYELVEDEGKFIFPACNSLFVCEDQNVCSDETVFPFNVETNLSGARMDPQVSPNNSDLVAFVFSNDIWVTSLRSGQEIRLTNAHKGYGTLHADPMSAGVSSFVVQEEFDRYTGYWWQPRTTPQTPPELACDSRGGCTYRILYEQVDESSVEILQIFAPGEDKGIDEYRYPRPGTDNASSSLKMAEFYVDEHGQIIEPVIEKSLYEPLTSFFPRMEYLVRAGWTPDSKYVYVQILNRQQTHLTLALIPLDCFVPPCSDIEMASLETRHYPPIHVIYEDISDIWVNVHDILYFFPQTTDDRISFLWSTEKTGYRHIYNVMSQFAKKSSQTESIFEAHEDVWKCDCVTERALTSGSWEVSGKQMWVDDHRQLVYFIGLKDTVLETHLYVVSYSNPGEVVRLTEPGYSHAVSFNSDCSMFVTVYSSIDAAPMSMLYRVFHDARIYTRPVGVLMASGSCPEYRSPELFSYDSSAGIRMHGMFYRPHGQEPGVRYPTVLFVYGGPNVQLVSNSFKGLKFLRLHTLASQGYAVVAIDGRGSSCRGLKFESHIKNRLGVTEIDDQVEGLQWLASQVDFIDLSRVAIHGWSYGGYLSLMGLAQRPDIFKVAIAGAPVVSWTLYDTGYTERYMDVPEANLAGYQQGCVVSYIENFPDQENRLLIIHGLIDENVHFHHTSQLVNALVKACKPYQLQVYPNERHGIRNHEASEHYKTMILNFLQNNL